MFLCETLNCKKGERPALSSFSLIYGPWISHSSRFFEGWDSTPSAARSVAFLAADLGEGSRLPVGGFAIQRQEDGKRGPVVIRSGPALHLDGPAMFFDNAASDPQTQAGANIFLGGKEWLEEAFSVLRFDPVAGIENGDPHAGPF